MVQLLHKRDLRSSLAEVTRAGEEKNGKDKACAVRLYSLPDCGGKKELAREWRHEQRHERIQCCKWKSLSGLSCKFDYSNLISKLSSHFLILIRLSASKFIFRLFTMQSDAHPHVFDKGSSSGWSRS